MAETLPRASVLRWGVRLATWLALFLLCLGLHFGLSWAQSVISPAARKKEAIATYTAQRPQQQTLGAIALVRPYGWFFKVSGPHELVGQQKEALETFLKSIQFSRNPDTDPTWTLPEGWKQQEGNELRFATIQIGGSDAPLELTVTKLPMRGGDEAEYVLANVNRWRGELGLEPLVTAEELEKQTKKIKDASADVTLVDMSAWLDGTPGRGDAYARTLAEIEEIARMRGETPPPTDIAFTLPKGWKEIPASPPLLSQFVVGEGDEPVEISISQAGGDLAMNVNRWRGQVGLEEASREQIQSAPVATKVSGLGGSQVEIVGPPGEKQKAILGVIAPAGGVSWFIKLRGPAKPALEQKQNFEAFVKSLKLE